MDGEGWGRKPHLYTYMVAVDEHGTVRGEIRDRAEGLSTQAVLDFLLGLGESRVFMFSFGYDLAKSLRDLLDEQLYVLARPERRQRVVPETGKTVHRYVYWRGYRLGFLRRRLTIQRTTWDEKLRRSVGAGPTVSVWDVFAFYQSRFVKALSDWKTARTDEELARVAAMKDHRRAFSEDRADDIESYCRLECRLLGRLVRQLLDACDAAALELRDFYGAGSAASALLRKMSVRSSLAPPPDEMRDAVACGFFGGRFDCSRVGPVRGPLWGYDVSSAYPYQLVRMPCLVHGKWELVTGSARHVRREVRGARLALVHCRVRRSGPSSWGPLPFRCRDGSIVFPLACASTWVWQDEYLAAVETAWPGVEALAAWCYRTECDCRPFGDLAQYYVERLRIGKEGPGIILKLAMNSCYGKLAQSVGSAPFRSWVVAGAVTSGTRGQLLRAIAAAPDASDVLMAATDGILSRSRLRLPEPEDTGTAATDKPLGAWEEKGEEWAGGAFLARPGIYWPLGGHTESGDKLRARGISRAILSLHAEQIERHFRRHGPHVPYVVEGRCERHPRRARAACPDCEARGVVRFVGLNMGVGPGKKGVIRRRASFGEWLRWPVECSFDPRPKRAAARRDRSLECWLRPPGGGESAPYDRAVVSREAAQLQQLTRVLEDSADGDVCLR